MIIEMLVGAGVVALGAATARVLMRRRAAAKAAEREGDKTDDKGKKDGDEKKKPSKKREEPAPEKKGPRGLRVGDVLLYADTELWLAGVIELDEEGLAARVFPTPGGARTSWVVQLDDQAHDLALLSETSDVPTGPVPEALPIGGRRLSLERRGHADVRTEGEHLPRTTGRTAYAILSDSGGRVLVVLDFEKAPRLALVGDRVGRDAIDLLPGGDLADGDENDKKKKKKK